MQNPSPDRGEVPARLRGRQTRLRVCSESRELRRGVREGSPALTNSSACRRASGDEAQDPSQLRPANRAPKRRSALAKHDDARPVLPSAPGARPGGTSDRLERVRPRPQGGGRSAGTYPRPGAESPAPTRASPGRLDTVRAAALAPLRASGSPLVPTCPPSPPPL